MCTTVNMGNDADTNGAVTGALAGAVYGDAAIPARWTAALLGREHILDVADRLADAGRRRQLAAPVCRRARRDIMLVPSGTPPEKAASPGSSPVVREATGKESLVAPAVKQLTKKQLIAELNNDLAKEYSALIQYVQHQAVITGPEYDSIRKELRRSTPTRSTCTPSRWPSRSTTWAARPR